MPSKMLIQSLDSTKGIACHFKAQKVTWVIQDWKAKKEIKVLRAARAQGEAQVCRNNTFTYQGDGAYITWAFYFIL